MNGLTDTRLYEEVRGILDLARSKTYAAVNSAMNEAYWRIGKQIEEAVGERAEYGKGLLQFLSMRLTTDFGPGFTVRNLRAMRQFYRCFLNRHTLCVDLIWSHYRLIMKVENENTRKFYLDESIKATWSVRQLDRQINSFFYERLLTSRDKAAVSAEIQKLEPGVTPHDVIKDLYVLEFLGLSHNHEFFENNLEKALLTHMQKFLLDLCRGFTFEAR
jgi:predicted nuclease of restriction endonuclease-like (RecB) superfamily